MTFVPIAELNAVSKKNYYFMRKKGHNDDFLAEGNNTHLEQITAATTAKYTFIL